MVSLANDLDTHSAVALIGSGSDLKFLGIDLNSYKAFAQSKLTELLDQLGDETSIDTKITQRLELLNAKNFEEADKIRDELASQGIQLKDSKDSQTGERITTWEVKR